MVLDFHFEIMKFQFTVWVVVILIREAESIFHISHLNRAIDYMQTYNGVHIKSVVLLTSHSYNLENNAFHEDIQGTASSNQKAMLILHMIMSENTSNTMDIIHKTTFPSLIIFPDFEFSKLLQKAFSEIDEERTRDKTWLIMLSSDYQSHQQMYITVLDAISTFPNYRSKFSLISQIYAVARIRGIVRLFELYQSCTNQPIVIRELTYLSEYKSSESNPTFIWDRRADLRQCSIRVGYFEYGSLLRNQSDYNLVVPESELSLKEGTRQTLTTGGLTMYGPMTQFFAMLQSRLNFSVSWVYVNDKKWGAFDNKTNDWNGIVGMIKRGQIDTSIMDLSVTNARSSVIKFTTPFRNYQYRLFMRKPGPSLSWNTFLDVFHVSYWGAFAASYIVCSMFLFSLSLYSNNVENEELKPWMKILKFGEALSTTARAFVTLDVDQLNYARTKTFISSRVLTLVICMCGMLNYYIYNAGLISYLMVQHYDLPIVELEDILKKPHYKLMVTEGSSLDDFLRYSYELDYKRIWAKTVKENGRLSTYGEIEKQLIDDDQKVLFGSSPSSEMMFDSYPCNVVASRVGYHFHSAAYGLSKDSQYVDLFNHHITSIREKGLETEWFDPEETITKCEDKHGQHFRRFSYIDVISAFVIFGLGCLLAVGYSAIEYTYTWWISRRKIAAIEMKEMLQNDLTRLQNFSMRNNDCVAQIEYDFTRKLSDRRKEGGSEIDALLCDISHRIDKIKSLLEQQI